MKTLLASIGLVGLSALSASAAVTLQNSSTSNYATNFLNSEGSNSATMVWGIVVDTTGNGFAGGAYVPGFSLAANSNGLVLDTADGLSDDVLYISSNLMNLVSAGQAGNDGSVAGMNRITNLTNIVYQNGVSQGDAFAIVWFDVTSLGGDAEAGLEYGLYEMPTLNTMPADPGTYNLSEAWAGPDAAKAMQFVLIPEPSALLLGALGGLALLRRRR